MNNAYDILTDAIRKPNYERIMNTLDGYARMSHEAWQDYDNGLIDGSKAYSIHEEFTSYRDFAEPKRDEVASILQGYHRQGYKEWGADKLGECVRVSSFEPGTKQWLDCRRKTIGGSDVGTLAVARFTPHKFSAKNVERLCEAKRNPQYARQESGALYRGSLWEEYLATHITSELQGYEFFETKCQWSRPRQDWFIANIDGLAQDSMGRLVLLEFKTGTGLYKWNPIPLEYKAQVMFYLYCFGFDQAIIHACINDTSFVTHTVSVYDEFVPGVYVDDIMKCAFGFWKKYIR